MFDSPMPCRSRALHDHASVKAKAQRGMGMTWHVLCLVTWYTHHVTKHNTPIHNILSTAPQLSISQKALGTLPEDGNVMPKHVDATIHNE
jgi:hypothetical protein